MKGNFEALVSEELFIKVQDVLDGKRVPVPHKKASEAFPLRGFIRCCECDKPLTAGFAVAVGESNTHGIGVSRKGAMLLGSPGTDWKVTSSTCWQ